MHTVKIIIRCFYGSVYYIINTNIIHVHVMRLQFYLYKISSAKPGCRTDWRIYGLRYQCKLNACNTSLVEFKITITNNKRCCYVMSLPYVCILLVQLEGYWGGFCCYLKPCAGSTPRDGFFIAAHVSLVSYNLHSYEMFLIWSNWT